jgi:dolichyl-phosphate-mannose--protein O-mannosyl transferase
VKTRIYVGVIALVGLALRLFNLGTPKGFVFDELYYVDGARDYLAHGVEISGNEPEFIVHPPVGKESKYLETVNLAGVLVVRFWAQ